MFLILRVVEIQVLEISMFRVDGWTSDAPDSGQVEQTRVRFRGMMAKRKGVVGLAIAGYVVTMPCC